MSSQTFVVRVVEIAGVTGGRGVVERVATGESVIFTSGKQLLDIVFAGGSDGDVEPSVFEASE